MHQYAADVIEFVYSTECDGHNETQRREMVYAFYGQYFLLIKEMDNALQSKDKEGTHISLKDFIGQKPQLAENLMEKLENIVQKLVEKGLARHTLVQAIMYDYIQSLKDHDRLKWLADTMKEKLPTLLASKKGLLVACSLFNVLDAKDRKLVVKSIQEPLKEMITNKVAHLFILHILNTLDDTVISKKKILNDILITIDENINDKCFQNIFLGIYAPNSKRYFSEDEVHCFEFNKELSTSKKDPIKRREELM